MRFSCKVLLVALSIAVALSAANLRYEIEYKQDAVRMSEQAVAQIVNEGLSAEIESHPYYKARVYIFPAGEFKNDYFVVYLFRSDIYFAPCFKLEIENSRVTRIVEDYISTEDQGMVKDECLSCPNPDAEVLVSWIAEFSSSVSNGRKTVAALKEYGVAVDSLPTKQETLTNVKNFLTCPKLKMWMRIGHGSNSSIQLDGGGSFTATSAPASDIKNKIFIFNSCLSNKQLIPGLVSNGAYFGASGNVNLSVGKEQVITYFATHAVKNKEELDKSMEAATKEANYLNAWGWSGNNSVKPWLYENAGNVVNPYITVSSPNGGELFELSTTQKIAWGDNIDGNVKIELFKGGSLKEVLAASVASNGSFQWTIPGNYLAGNDYKVKITSIDSAALNDESNANFSIIAEYILACPYRQTFDTLDTGKTILPAKWEQSTTDNFDWLVWKKQTPTKLPANGGATGADADHTSGSGNYIYVESSDSPFSGNPSKKVDFTTPKFNFKSLSDPKLSFWYHMFSDNEGADEMGELHLDICVDGTWKNDVFTISKNQGDKWNEKVVDLNPYKGDRVILKFRAITGSGWASDICLDDIKIDGLVPINTTIATAAASCALQFYQSKIHYQVPENMAGTQISLKLYDMKGKLIRTLHAGAAKTGSHFIAIDKGANGNTALSEGMYLCRMEVGDYSEAVKLMIKK